MHVGHIEGMAEEKSKRLLKNLLAKSTIERNIYRHSWQPGDLVIWDNRCLLQKLIVITTCQYIPECYIAQLLEAPDLFRIEINIKSKTNFTQTLAQYRLIIN